jgi:hypothetical protein
MERLNHLCLHFSSLLLFQTFEPKQSKGSANCGLIFGLFESKSECLLFVCFVVLAMFANEKKSKNPAFLLGVSRVVCKQKAFFVVVFFRDACKRKDEKRFVVIWECFLRVLIRMSAMKVFDLCYFWSDSSKFLCITV